MRSRLLGPVALSVVLLLSGCAGAADPDPAGAPVANVSVDDPDGLHGAVLPTPYDAPHTDLEATDGSTYDLAADPAKPLTIVFFGYTHCPDVCQIVMADVASALTRVEPGERSRVDVLFVTTDPARDDAATLRDYLDRFDPAFEGLTGPLPAVVAAGKALGVEVEKGERLPTGGYEVMHGTHLLGLLPDGTVPVVWTEGTPAGDLAEDIASILRDGVVDLEPVS